MHSQDNSYNNADSFAMFFDQAWKKTKFDKKENLTIEEKIQTILQQNKEHPFIKSSPLQAVDVAKFRLRLLQLE